MPRLHGSPVARSCSAWLSSRDRAERGPGVRGAAPGHRRPRGAPGLRRPDQQRPVRRGEHADDAQHARAGRRPERRDPAPPPEDRAGVEPVRARTVSSARARTSRLGGGPDPAGPGPIGSSAWRRSTRRSSRLPGRCGDRPTGRPARVARPARLGHERFPGDGGSVAKGARVTAAIVEDPLYPHGSKVWGPSPAPGEALSVKEVGRQFVRRGNNSWGTRETAGMYVLVLPYELDAPTLDRPVGSPRSGRPADVHGPRLSKDHSPRSRRPGLRLQLGRSRSRTASTAECV